MTMRHKNAKVATAPDLRLAVIVLVFGAAIALAGCTSTPQTITTTTQQTTSQVVPSTTTVTETKTQQTP